MFAFDFGKSRRRPRHRPRDPHTHGAEPGDRAAGVLVGLLVNITFALLMAFFRATYLDLWRGGAVRGADVDFRPVLHHRRAVSGQQAVAPGADLRLRRGGIDGLKFIVLPVLIGVIGGIGGGAAGIAPSSSRKSARTMCAPRAPRACPKLRVLFRHVLKNAHDPDPHRRGGGDPAAVHGQPDHRIVLRHSRPRQLHHRRDPGAGFRRGARDGVPRFGALHRRPDPDRSFPTRWSIRG